MNRREMIQYLGILGIGAAAGLGFTSSGTPEQPFNPEQDKVRETLDYLESQIRLFIEQQTTLSEQDIKKELAHCGFIDQDKLTLQEWRIEEQKMTVIDGERLLQLVKQAQADGDFILNENALNLIQVNFDNIGQFFAQAFYVPDIRTIFIKQENPAGKEQNIRKILFKEATNKVPSGKPANLASLPRETMLARGERLRKHVELYRILRAKDFVANKSALTHEAFHDFLHRQFIHTGYDGPGPGTLLAVALKGRRKRFGNTDPSYAKSDDLKYGMEGLLNALTWKVTENDQKNTYHVDEILDKALSTENSGQWEEVLWAFCEQFATDYDVVNPKTLNADELQRLDGDGQYMYLIQHQFSKFLHEYWARIFTGAVGYTPKSMKDLLDRELATLGVTVPERWKPEPLSLQERFHEPNSEDLRTLSEMKWNGKPILQ